MILSGWLDPDGGFHECGMFSHMVEVADNPALRKLVPDLEANRAYLEGVSEGCDQGEEEGGHGCWHNYHMAAMEVSCEIRDTLLCAGCLRVGSDGDVVCFEGVPTATTLQAAKDLAENYNLRPVFEAV